MLLSDLCIAKSNGDITMMENLKVINENLLMSFARKLVGFVNSIFGAIIDFIKKIINWIYRLLFDDDLFDSTGDSSGGSSGGGGGGSSGGGGGFSLPKVEIKIRTTPFNMPRYFLPETIRTEMVGKKLFSVVKLPEVNESMITDEIIRHLENEVYTYGTINNRLLEKDFQEIMNRMKNPYKKLDEIDKLIDSEHFDTYIKLHSASVTLLRGSIDSLENIKKSNNPDKNVIDTKYSTIKSCCLEVIKYRNDAIIIESRLALIKYLAEINLDKETEKTINVMGDSLKKEAEKQKKEAIDKIAKDREEAIKKEEKREVIYRKYNITNIFSLFLLLISTYASSLKSFFDRSINDKDKFSRLYIQSSKGDARVLNQLTDYSFFKVWCNENELEGTNEEEILNKIKAKTLAAAFNYRSLNKSYENIQKLADVETLYTIKEIKEDFKFHKRNFSEYKSISNKIINIAKEEKQKINSLYEKALAQTEYKEIITQGYQKAMAFFSKTVNLINRLTVEMLKDLQGYMRALNNGETFTFDNGGTFESFMRLNIF